MGIFQSIGVRIAAGRLAKVEGVMKAFGWLTDPAHPGRKRGIAAGLLLAGFVLRGVGAGLKSACEQALVAGSACGLDPAGWASWVDTANAALQTYAVPGAELTGVLMGIWGLVHARQKAKAA